MIEVANSCRRAAADDLALAEAGFPTWLALATAHAARIMCELDRVPPACDPAGVRLLAASRRFISGPHWLACVRAGWPIADVFGIDRNFPLERRRAFGLVPTVAFAPHVGRRLEAITDAGAVFRDPNGRAVTFSRPSLFCAVFDVVPWWQSAAIVADEAA